MGMEKEKKIKSLEIKGAVYHLPGNKWSAVGANNRFACSEICGLSFFAFFVCFAGLLLFGILSFCILDLFRISCFELRACFQSV